MEWHGRMLQPRLKYTTGVIRGWSLMQDHVVSVVGWGTDPDEGLYWNLAHLGGST